ncbi:MAG: peptide chain release factor N(5)-glutamine methyltransferase [Pseudomonadales bacterium]
MTMTIGTLLGLIAQQLSAASDSARLDAEVLMCHVLDKSRTFLYTWPERELTQAQFQGLQVLVERRLAGEPVAYLTGSREFWSLELDVSPDTLIPRPDTELLVEIGLELLPLASAPQQVLDLGTGTGAIALALASEKPDWQFCGVDRVSEAVALAQRNQQKLQIANARFFESDWFSALGDEKFHLIVSNPPYIDNDDEHLQQGDVRFEPRSALVAGKQGLQDYQKIISEAADYLSDQGWLLFEHGYEQGAAVRDLLLANGFVDVQTRCDLAGHERATFGQWLLS